MPFQVMSCDFLKNHRLKRNQEGKGAASVTSVDVAPCSPGMAPFMTSTETNRPFDRKDVTNVPSPSMWGCLENTKKQPCFILFRLIYSSTSAVLCINSELAFHFPQGCSLSRRRVKVRGPGTLKSMVFFFWLQTSSVPQLSNKRIPARYFLISNGEIVYTDILI